MFATGDSLTLTNDPAWPWSISSIGLPALGMVALALTILTVWTYLGVSRDSVRRIALVLGLRLAALLVACLAVLRPSVAYRNELKAPSTLLLAIDASSSMSIQDEFDSQARWTRLLDTLKKAEAKLGQLQAEQNIDILRYRFDSDVGELDPSASPVGKRTDFGELLHQLDEKHRGDNRVRSLLILSDGADNGTRYAALELAGRWRARSTIHTVGFGNPATSERQSDIAFSQDGIKAEPAPVPVKGELTLTAFVDAMGFENAPVTIRLLLDDKEMPIDKLFINERDVTKERDRRLPKSANNELKVVCTAPDKPGEIKVTLKIDPLPGEVTESNNEISTFVTVAKEGLSILLVDKLRTWEPQFLCDALRMDPTIRLRVVWMRKDGAPAANQADLFQFDKQHYDVIILGDVTARQLTAGNPGVLATIHRLVSEKGTGLMMLGGAFTFGNSDWQGTDIDKLLPVKLDVRGQVTGDVKIQPVAEQLQQYIMSLADRPQDNARIWEQLLPLNGMTRLGKPRDGAFELARAANGEPILVGQTYGNGRTLAFAGDSTWRWRNSPETLPIHSRFWKQVALWLAKQEERKGNLVVKPDARRLASGSKLGFTVGLRGKGGVDAKEAHFEVKVVGPGNVETPVETLRDKEDERGSFWKTDNPGEYRLVVRGWGKEADGSDIPAETATSRFLVYQDDAELARRAADHEFLKKLAAAGGGQFHRPEELMALLQELQNQAQMPGRARAELWPDWRKNSLSGFIVGWLLAFVALLSCEWFLRRRWGMV
jgi:uncharacterized membrane protein